MLDQRMNGSTVRKTLLVFVGLLVCVYAVGVLCYVLSLPDIGLRCAFKTELSYVYNQYRWTTPRPLLTGERGATNESPQLLKQALSLPHRGDLVLTVGGKAIEVWPRLLRALIDLEPAPEPVSSTEEAEERHLRYVRVGEDRLVFVTFESAESPTGQLMRYGCWWRIGHLPLEEVIPSILWFSLKIGLFMVGALVFWKRPTDRTASQFFLLCIVTVGAYMGGYHWARIATQPLFLLVFMICGVLLPVVSLHFYLIFPRPKAFLARHPGGTLAAVYGPAVVFLVALMLAYLRLRWLVRGGGSVNEIGNAWQTLRTEIAVYVFVAALSYLFSLGALVHSFRRATDVTERNQVKWILFGTMTALVPIGYTLYLIYWEQDAFGAGQATWPMFAASACLTLAFAVSITRYRLLELDKIISSGAVYLLISVCAALLYYGVVFAAMWAANMVGTKIVPSTSLPQALWVSTTALILMVLLNLIRGRLKKVLDRRFYREKHQLDRTLNRMGEAIDQLVDPPTLARRLLQACGELLNVSRGAIYLREGDLGLYRLADHLGPTPPSLAELSSGCPLVEVLQKRKMAKLRVGEMSDPAQRQLRLLGGEVAYALAHEEQVLAFLVLGPKLVGSYRADDLDLLAAFCRLTALALESAQGHRTIEALNHELRAKVEKISEQQRRIFALQNQLTKGLIGRAPPAPVAGSPQAVGTDASIPAALVAQAPDAFAAIIGSGTVLRQVLDLARKVAATPAAVLIRGESGTGKELFALALHAAGPRAGKPYVTVHCAALSPGLLESELFGHVKGAFTGAHRDKVGRFELANGGTLFLDEIGDISLEVQTKLLRAIQDKTFERVGSSNSVKVDVRVIAATHRNLEELVRQGQFREDLYYRLKVVDLTMPPLRDRREDIPELALHFARVCGQRTRQTPFQIDDDALPMLKAYDWPGNIRELENVIERAVVIAEGPTITVQDLPPELLSAVESQASVDPSSIDDGNGVETPTASNGVHAERYERGRRERERLVRALASADGNKAEAARALGLARSTLVSRLKKHGLC
jgi:transcriptional regulator with GAF, ATPase, and Fis domain